MKYLTSLYASLQILYIVIWRLITILKIDGVMLAALYFNNYSLACITGKLLFFLFWITIS